MDDDPPRDVPSDPKPVNASAAEVSPWALAGLGMQFVLALLVFVYAGNWMDRRLGTAPLCLLLGVFVGGGGTFFLSVKRLTASTATTPSSKVRSDK
jgi:F0F1-type ATP synthase assembly protein I